MRKIINTFKFGDKKVKRSLGLAIFAGVVTAVFGILAIAMSNMLCFFVAIVASFITITLVQTFMIAEGENPTVVRTAEFVADSMPKVELERVEKPRKTITKSVKEKKTKNSKQAQVTQENVPTQDTLQEQEVYLMEDSLYIDSWEDIEDDHEESAKKKSKKEKAKKEKNKKKTAKEKNKQPKAVEDSSDTFESDKTANIPGLKNQSQVITADTAATYTKKKIRKTLHKYKVIKDHRMVIVDRCDRLHIHQTPAYVWIQENQLHILLIEEEPRLLMVPLFRITEITYLKKQPAEPDKDYSIFKKSTILTECFRPYLPDYNQSNKTSDLTYYKNLYGITQGIYFTNNSAKNLFDLLGVDFYVEDKVTTSDKVNIFFKDAYKANIKLRDNILDANGYADSITKILDDMAHSTISYAEFKDTLNLMTKNKLITDEYANHYMDVRNSLRG